MTAYTEMVLHLGHAHTKLAQAKAALEANPQDAATALIRVNSGISDIVNGKNKATLVGGEMEADDAQIAALSISCADLNAAVASHLEVMEAQEAAISGLHADIDVLNDGLDAKDAEILALRHDIESAQTTLSAYAAQVITLNEALNVKDAEIADLNLLVSDLQARIAELEEGETTPPPPPPPPPPPAPSAYPDATNTGAKGTLTAASWPSITSGTVIENKILTGGRDITASNVTIRNCRITGGWVNAKGAQNFLMEDCTVIGNGALKGVEFGNGIVRRCDISGVQNGAIIEGSGYIFRDNYIHDLSGGGADPHYDGIEVYGPSSNGLIEHNAIHSRDTSCIFVANLWGAHDNVTINDNLLTGADMPVRTEGTKSSQPITNVRWTNNKVENGHWGYKTLVRGTASQWSVSWTGNTDANTGAAI